MLADVNCNRFHRVDSQPGRGLGTAFFCHHLQPQDQGHDRMLLTHACPLLTKGRGNRKSEPSWPILRWQICWSDHNAETFVPTHLPGTGQVKSSLEGTLPYHISSATVIQLSTFSRLHHMDFIGSSTCFSDAVRTQGSSKYSKYSYSGPPH